MIPPEKLHAGCSSLRERHDRLTTDAAAISTWGNTEREVLPPVLAGDAEKAAERGVDVEQEVSRLASALPVDAEPLARYAIGEVTGVAVQGRHVLQVDRKHRPSRRQHVH